MRLDGRPALARHRASFSRRAKIRLTGERDMAPRSLIERVDLLLLSVKAPLSDAVGATVCGRWREAADLWLDVYREPAYRSLSARCGLEATLNAGLYDLAQYFHICLSDAPSLPDFLREAWRQSLPIRRDRARFHAGRTDASSGPGPRAAARRLVDLRFYREAIREIFQRRLFQIDRGAAVPLLAECYFRLGEHEALVALHRSQRLFFTGAGIREMLRNTRAAMAREALGPVQNALDFAQRHPAGHLLAPFLEAPESAFAKYG